MMTTVSFVLDGRIRSIDFSLPGAPSPTTTVLEYLRGLPDHKGVKEGCAEGDCGACTVVVAERTTSGAMRYLAVDSCLIFLPALHGKWLITVENLKNEDGSLHPVQQHMVESYGSQCGFCTPGIIMSMFALYRSGSVPDRASIAGALEGNLCRCTGYRSIVEAAERACSGVKPDAVSVMESSVGAMLDSIPESSLVLSTPACTYWKPASLPEAVSLLHAHPDALVVGGGTDVALRVTKKHDVLPRVIDISDLPALREISESDGELRVGGGVTITEVMPHLQKNFPALHAMCEVYGSRQIRNVATLGGNLGTASPISDSLPALMAHGARVVVEGLDGRKEFPVDGFLTGYRKTRRRPAELITRIILPKQNPAAVTRFYKISRRRNLDISTLSGAFSLTRDSNNNVTSMIVAMGGMAETARRADRTEKFIVGKPWTRSTIDQARGILADEFTPISDVRGSARFRSLAAGNLLVKFWSETRSDDSAGK